MIRRITIAVLLALALIATAAVTYTPVAVAPMYHLDVKQLIPSLVPSPGQEQHHK